jgi:heme exporter protein B
MRYLGKVWAIVWKDIVAELRTREMFSAMFVFAVLVVVIFHFAFDLRVTGEAVREVAPGALWVAFAFSGILGLNRAFVAEKDRGCLDGLLLAPVDRSAIYFGKMLGNLVFMLIVEIIVLPVYSILYNTNLFNPGLLAVILLGSIGYVAVGTLLSSMAVQTRTRDILLPILLFPVALPLFIAAVKASTGFLQGLEMAEISPWLNLLIVYDLVFTAVSFMVFDYVVEE